MTGSSISAHSVTQGTDTNSVSTDSPSVTAKRRRVLVLRDKHKSDLMTEITSFQNLDKKQWVDVIRGQYKAKNKEDEFDKLLTGENPYITLNEHDGVRFSTDVFEMCEKFDLLDWWKTEGMTRFPILAKVAPLILAKPEANGFQESCFSTSTLLESNKLRRRLHRKTFALQVLLGLNEDLLETIDEKKREEYLAKNDFSNFFGQGI